MKHVVLEGTEVVNKILISSIARISSEKSGKYLYLLDGKRFTITGELYELIDSELFKDCLNPKPSIVVRSKE